MMIFHIKIMCILCAYTLGCFLIYDNEYGREHYDNDDDHHHHASHDTREFANLQTSSYEQLT